MWAVITNSLSVPFTGRAGILSRPSRRHTVIDACVTEHTFLACPDERFNPDRYDIAAAPPTMLLDGGEIFDLGDRRFEVLHYPGHSPGSIALWESGTGVLFSGDIVYDGDLSDKLYHSDRGECERSLARLREIPVRIVHGGIMQVSGVSVSSRSSIPICGGHRRITICRNNLPPPRRRSGSRSADRQ
jgi:Metallo-beta-lactamase superfamily